MRKIIILTAFLIFSLSPSDGIVVAKPKISNGIKTSDSAKNQVQIDHNYSKVAGHVVSDENHSRNGKYQVHPVFDGKNPGYDPAKKIVVRIKKQVQVFSKCPPGATGQFVYALACNQFLNCFKGRTFVQNCPAGTLFNPETSTCDFPHKVRCVTGPDRTNFEENPAASRQKYQRSVQPPCPENFSGTMPHYANCTKFIMCAGGKPIDQLCPPGTLFDTKRNLCDFPHAATCINGEESSLKTPQEKKTRVCNAQQCYDIPLDAMLDIPKYVNRDYRIVCDNVQCYYVPIEGAAKLAKCDRKDGQCTKQPQFYYPLDYQGGDCQGNRCQNAPNCIQNNCGQSSYGSMGSHLPTGDQRPSYGSAGVYQPNNAQRPSYGSTGPHLPTDNQRPSYGSIGGPHPPTDNQRPSYGSIGGPHLPTDNQRPSYGSIGGPHLPTDNQRPSYGSIGGPHLPTDNQRPSYGSIGGPHLPTDNQRPSYGSVGGPHQPIDAQRPSYGSIGGPHQPTDAQRPSYGSTGPYQPIDAQKTSYGFVGGPHHPIDAQRPSYGSTGPYQPIDAQRTSYGSTNSHISTGSQRPSYGSTGPYHPSDTQRPLNGYEEPKQPVGVLQPPINHNKYPTQSQNTAEINYNPSIDKYEPQSSNVYHTHYPSNRPTNSPNCKQNNCQISGHPSYGNRPPTSAGTYTSQASNVHTVILHPDQPSRTGKGFPSRPPTDFDQNINHGRVFEGATCPRGAQGLHPHPKDCSKFLSCANGMTHVMDCGPGTLFNPAMKICDFAYNVKCHVDQSRNGDQDTSASSYQSNYNQRPGYNHGIDQTTRQNLYHRPTESSNQGRPQLVDNPKNDQSISNFNGKPTNIREYYDAISGSKYPDQNNQDHEDVGPKNDRRFTISPAYNRRNSGPIDANIINEKREADWPPPFQTANKQILEYYDYDVVDRPLERITKEVDDCQGDVFRCSDHECVAKSLACNGGGDCSNAKDEENCRSLLDEFEFVPNKHLDVPEIERWDNATVNSCAYLCLNSKNFTCKSFNYRKLDGCCVLTDENVGSSGKLRTHEPSDFYEWKHAKIPCDDPSRFKCSNDKCIRRHQMCDGEDDCGNRDDEKGCPADKIGYSIKLSGSEARGEGRIEIAAFGNVGFVCDDNFDIKAADVACRELGFRHGAMEVRPNSYYDYGSNNMSYIMDDVSCTGNETSLRDCDFAGWTLNDCTPQEIVGVVCKTEELMCPDSHWKCLNSDECIPMVFLCDGLEDCKEGSDEFEDICKKPIAIRLANGTAETEGRLEVKYHGVWGTVCDDDFNDDAAKVVCKGLGYKNAVAVKKEGYFGRGKGPIWLDQVFCSGNETSLDRCGHWTWGQHNCDHSEDVGVICTNDTDDFGRHGKQSKAEIRDVPKTTEIYPVYPERCGLRKDSVRVAGGDVHFRVVQGSKAAPGDYPWQASLRVKGLQHATHWCGAVIISAKFVLTAAHCLVGYPKGAYVVVAGDYDVQQNEGTEQTANIDEFYVHEDFRKGRKMNNDIALIKLKGDGFVLNDDVRAICLPSAAADYETPHNCTISGFGSEKSGTSVASNELLAGDVPILAKDVCKLPHVYGDEITDGMFCAGFLTGGTDACDGDSGGPLACLDGGYYTLYGITSWGHRCGFANKPGVYVKVAYYRDWIEKKIKENA